MNTEKNTATAIISLPEVTLVCVDTVNPELAILAMRRCIKSFRFGKTLLLTDRPIPTMPDIKVELIDGICDVETYSEFVICRLSDYIETTHALLVQWDGFIIHPEMWDPEFLTYDYIGATWPASKGRPEMVGNGGFSLRSKKLLQALKGIRFEQFHPEDEHIALTHRVQLESQSIRFAPTDVGDRFSYEFKKPSGKTFGFHGFSNFPDFMDTEEMVAFITGMPRGLIFNNYFIEFARKVLKSADRRSTDQYLRQMLTHQISVDISNTKSNRLASDQVKHLISGLCRLRLGSLARSLASARFYNRPSLSNLRLLAKTYLAR